MIRLEHISYSNKNTSSNQTVQILDDINLEFFKGNIYAIIGANGAGKSTLLDIISGIKKPTRGVLTKEEKNIHQRNQTFLEYIEGLGYCVQNPDSAFFHKTVQEELLFSTENQELLDQVIKQYHLKDLLNLSPFQLSGGQKKRLLFVLNLLDNPTILLTDELTAGLDHGNKQLIMDEVLANKKERVTIMITHNLEDALYYADSLVVLSDKNVYFAGSSQEVIMNPELLTSVGFQMPNTFKICQSLINQNIFEKQQYYFDSKEIGNQLLLQLKGVGVNE